MMWDIMKLFRQHYHQNSLVYNEIAQVNKDTAQEPGQWFNCLCSLLFKEWEVFLLQEVVFHLWPGPSNPYTSKIFSSTCNLVREVQQDKVGSCPYKGTALLDPSKEQRAKGQWWWSGSATNQWPLGKLRVISQVKTKLWSWSVGQDQQGWAQASQHHSSVKHSDITQVLGQLVASLWVKMRLLITPSHTTLSASLAVTEELNTRLFGHAESELTLNTSSQTPRKADESVQRLLMCTEPWHLLCTWTSL